MLRAHLTFVGCPGLYRGPVGQICKPGSVLKGSSQNFNSIHHTYQVSQADRSSSRQLHFKKKKSSCRNRFVLKTSPRNRKSQSILQFTKVCNYLKFLCPEVLKYIEYSCFQQQDCNGNSNCVYLYSWALSTLNAVSWLTVAYLSHWWSPKEFSMIFLKVQFRRNTLKNR